MQKLKRAPLWRVLASVLTAALVASGAALGVAAPAQAADGPTISVTEAPRAGGNVTVTGSGFSAAQPGIYLGVRQDGVSTDAYTVWLSTTNTVGELPGLGATAPMNADGSFSIEVPVAAQADGVSFSIVTRKAHGVQDPSQVTSTAIVYQPAPATSTTTSLTVSPSGTAVAGAQVTLTATVAPSGATGSVAFADGSTSLGSAAVADGSASVQVSTLAVGSHQLTATFVPADAAVFADSSSAATSYSITAAPSYTLAGAVTVTEEEKISVAVSGSGYANIQPLPGQQTPSLYVALIPQGTPLSEVSQGGSLPSISVSPSAQGDIAGTLEQAAAGLDRTKSYEIIAWPSRSFPSDSNLYARAAVEIDWNALFPPAAPVLAVSKSTDLARTGETITVTGSGYDPTKPMYLTTCTDIPLEDVTFAFISAGCTGGAKLISPNPTRPTMVKLNADGTFETTLTVAPKGATTAVYTIADHTAQADRSQDAKVSVSFDIPAPSLTVTPNTDVDPSGDTLTVTGTNYVKPASDRGFTARFGWVKDTWKPSEGGKNADRPGAVITRVSDVASDSGIAWTDNGDGTVDFEWTIDVSEAAANEKKPEGGNPKLGVFTFGNTASQGTQPDNELFVPVAWAEAEPQPEPTADPKVTVTPNENLDPAVENVLTVSGTGFRGASAVNGAYVLFGETAVWQGEGPPPSAGWITQAWVMPGQIVDGAFSLQVTVPAGTLDGSKSYNVATSAAHMLSVTDRSLDTFTPVSVARQGGDIAGATLTWGVKQSFRSYITGPIAKGSISLDRVAQNSEGLFIWSNGVGEYDVADAAGSVDYPGSVHFTGHDGQLDMLLANPRVEVKDAESGVLYLDVTSRALDGTVTSETAVPFASLVLSAPVTTEEAATWVNSAATLTEQGAASFAGFYAAGTVLDPVTFTFPVGGEVTPVVGVSSSSVAQGGTLTITGSGFDENELVSAEIHSDVVTLPAQAAVGGVVSFAWTVPADFATGVHTVYLLRAGDTLQSALSTTFTVTARAETPGGGTDPVVSQPVDEQPAAQACVAQSVSGASIQWGVKESFRSYITGPIAKGSISGGWGSGSGAYSADTDRGRVSYGGSIHYTGHSGLLDLTLSNPRIQVNSATSASLILNVQSKGFNGSPDINASGVVFATLSLPSASESSGRIAWNGASATLTAAGAEAFAGFYTAGTALDAVSFSFPLGAQVACDATTDRALASTGAGVPTDALWFGIGVIAFGGMLLVAMRRRQRA
ncbi:HtaA domain-containing protein [Microbacterium sp. SORGH_AS_0862]|uniref:HtaA domain-containing protein n=1 Tax=Microbacterium sp. SORGH_AS_0862 TaxID=3041789 RepID=UPI00278E0CE2|nr:HtaA domain-containing protein [Microbacterium sp. SORGH_AS_0862]MDQ1205395.1 hypothetical protein [Microbacterium sp. SORGH_AS_0862]